MKFRKKPVVIDATQWFKDGDHPSVVRKTAPDRHADEGIPWIATLEGGHIVTPGDWIITGVKGELYPCKPDIFTETYDEAGEEHTLTLGLADHVLDEITEEMERAVAKFPTWPNDPLHALSVLGEEFGELTKEVLQLTYEPDKTSHTNLRKEAIQTAAMALRFAMSLGLYQFKRSAQHEQEAINVPF